MPDRTELRAWARTQTLLETDDVTNAEVDAILNQGLRTLSTKFQWPWLASSMTTAFVDAQQAYALPVDVSTIEKVLYVGKSDPIEEKSATEVWRRKGDSFRSGDPKYFFIWGTDMYFDPIPTATSGSFKLQYYTAPTPMANDTDEPPFATQFHMILAKYAVARLWEREEDFSKAQEADDQFLDMANDMARHYLNQADDHPSVFGGGDSQSAYGGYGNRPPFDWLDAP